MEYLQQVFSKFFGSDTATDYAAFCSTPKKILTFGNVLLDHTVHFEFKSLLEQYQLEEGIQDVMDSETLQKLITDACGEASDTKCIINPGGSALNTVRILKLLGTDATFFGAVGNDENGDKLKDILEEHCIDARLQTISDCPTGLCICLVKDDKRTLIANVGAAKKFSMDFLKSHVNGMAEANTTPTKGSTLLRPIEQKQIIYIEGFFVPDQEEICDYVIKNFIHGRRRLAVNLSAPYIIKQNYAQLLHLVQHAMFIFGNEIEFKTLSEQMGCTTSDGLASRLLQDGALAKIVVITKGANGVDLITNFIDEQSPPGDISFQSFNVPRIQDLVDTTGAGDTFVAGFLHAWLEKRSLTECIRVASDLAGRVCTQIGCFLPEE